MFASYEILALLGEGSAGVVYKARQRTLDRLVAIKLLLPPEELDLLHSNQRFENEAHALAQLSHPNIVSIYDFGQTTDGNYFFIAMEFADGSDLVDAIRCAGRLTQDRALEIMETVCDALAHAHAQGIIHRDIKPANVLISSTGQIKVADFGISKLTGSKQSPHHLLTQPNMVMGTADYAAPEILTPGGKHDERADLFSLGVMFYQMIVGEVPRGRFRLPSIKRPELDPRLDGIIARALEPNPNRRYQSIGELHHDLKQIRLAPFNARPKARRLIWLGFGVVIVTIMAVALMKGKIAPFATHPPPIASLPSPGVGDDWLNLLDGFNVIKNAKMRPWQLVDGELRTPIDSANNEHETIEFPIASLPQNYDLRIELMRNNGISSMTIPFLHGDSAGCIEIDAFTSNKDPYLSRLGNVGSDIGGPYTYGKNLFLGQGKRHVLLLEVRDQSVTVLLDEEVLLHWPADWPQLYQSDDYYLPTELVDHPILGVCACADFTFNRIDIRKAAD